MKFCSVVNPCFDSGQGRFLCFTSTFSSRNLTASVVVSSRHCSDIFRRARLVRVIDIKLVMRRLYDNVRADFDSF
ncbi:hypothetical protein M378DRAFT_437101 [Amanita muscaria Koide BX008]|uniref:Uncharacterized protein n=1 Tax=Amanita muscaria (strain Koide BX008) TaxID=946122 RepID=A0A0C2S2A5_AMAMK|nr:hypothetical protein M378DRAFT_437101 [Amanita muscaria Koide BX008]